MTKKEWEKIHNPEGKSAEILMEEARKRIKNRPPDSKHHMGEIYSYQYESRFN